MPTEGLEPPWPDYKTGTLPIKWNRLYTYIFTILIKNRIKNLFNTIIN
jgi:hypothetical protein